MNAISCASGLVKRGAWGEGAFEEFPTGGVGHGVRWRPRGLYLCAAMVYPHPVEYCPRLAIAYSPGGIPWRRVKSLQGKHDREDRGDQPKPPPGSLQGKGEALGRTSRHCIPSRP